MIVAAHYNTEYNFAYMLSDDGNLISEHTYKDTPYGSDYNGMVVASNGDIYIAGRWENKVLRMDKNCNILAEATGASYIITIAIDPDGYIWSSEISDVTNNAIFKKRDPLTLEILDTCDGYDAASAYAGLIFDSEGFLYTVCWTGDEIEKWNVVTKTRVSNRALAGGPEDNPIMSELRTRGETIYLMQWASSDYGDYFTCPTDLSEDFTPHELVEFDDDPETDTGYWANNIVQLSTTGWIVMGIINQELHVIRYDNDFTLVWDYQIDGVAPEEYGYNLSVGWHPVAVGDYPLAPVLFPAKVQRSTLKQKCVLFEKSMEDVCLTLNHNVNVTRRYLLETYGDTVYAESSNLRDILSSQQLVKLHGKDLDYNAIINNFIKNISDMFILINENNTLIKAWLDDYVPNEVGHEFTDVEMRPIVVGEDLSKAMDDLFAGIEDNVTVLNTNIETLIERF